MGGGPGVAWRRKLGSGLLVFKYSLTIRLKSDDKHIKSTIGWTVTHTEHKNHCQNQNGASLLYTWCRLGIGRLLIVLLLQILMMMLREEGEGAVGSRSSLGTYPTTPGKNLLAIICSIQVFPSYLCSHLRHQLQCSNLQFPKPSQHWHHYQYVWGGNFSTSVFKDI